MSPDPYGRTGNWTLGCLRWRHGRDASTELGRAQGDLVIDVYRGVVGVFRWLHHDELNSVVPEKDTGHQGSEQHEDTSTSPRFWGGADNRHYTESEAAEMPGWNVSKIALAVPSSIAGIAAQTRAACRSS